MTLADLQFQNRYVEQLPGDPETRNYIRQVRSSCYSVVHPTGTSDPKLVAYSKEMSLLLGLSEDDWELEDFVRLFSGNLCPDQLMPYAMCYGGHQFGSWAGQLGDGRAITLGEITGNDNVSYALQLKGSGLTPYSRTADGRAVLRSSLREYVCSEAMHYLGVPTTRALSLILTGDQVVRDMLYNGNPQHELGAVVCRVSPSFTRFGNFEIFAAQQDTQTLSALADFTIKYDFPEIEADKTPTSYVKWFEEVVDRTAHLMAEWLRVGFVHGVMNTDNMSILGLTIDYGPYGWVENFDLNWTPNTTDAATKRYRFGAQPDIAQWNLLQLANAIFPLIGETKPLSDALKQFEPLFQTYFNQVMQRKLGLESVSKQFLDELFHIFSATETDMTIFFRTLADLDLRESEQTPSPVDQIKSCYYHPDEILGELRERINKWLKEYLSQARNLGGNEIARRMRMKLTNPLYVPRNYLAQLAIDDAEKGEYEFLNQWMAVLQNPYTEQQGQERFAEKRPDWARRRTGCSMLSCSS